MCVCVCVCVWGGGGGGGGVGKGRGGEGVILEIRIYFFVPLTGRCQPTGKFLLMSTPTQGAFGGFLCLFFLQRRSLVHVY